VAVGKIGKALCFRDAVLALVRLQNIEVQFGRGAAHNDEIRMTGKATASEVYMERRATVICGGASPRLGNPAGPPQRVHLCAQTTTPSR
jgi:hypothetical protein